MDDDDDAFAEHQDLFANKSGAPGLLAKISFDFAGPDFQPSSEDDEVEPAVEPAIEPAIEPEQRDTDDGHEENAEHNSRATSSPLLVEDTVEKEHVVQVVDVDDDSPPPQELASRTRIQIALQDMPVERRNEYAAVYSEVIESIVGGVVDQVERRYMAEFTDGRQKTVTLHQLAEYKNGKAALYRFRTSPADMPPRKRKFDGESEFDSQESEQDLDPDLDPMDLDLDDENEAMSVTSMPEPHQDSSREIRTLRTRGTSTRQTSHHHSDSDSDDLGGRTRQPRHPARTLRTRQPRLSSMGFNGLEDLDQDELSNSPHPLRDGVDDDFFPTVTSDLVQSRSRANRARQPSRRLHTKGRSNMRQPARQGSPDSDIEFEAPRRSVRATRATGDMRDVAFMDEDSFYFVDDQNPAVPKAVSVRETFQPVAPESEFAAVHMGTCHTCGGSRQKGQLIHCQGCILSFHRHCIGIRSAREHIATKIGDDSFVLQCRFCIGIYRKKDGNAPKHSMCQDCHSDGKACTPFSEKKTSRQEEKLREQNDGVDPITPVTPTLINNSDIVMFRCSACHRGWHIDHLPSVSNASVGTDVRSERLADYAIDWRCNECSSAKYKIHRIVAWRPTQPAGSHENRPQYEDVDDDSKEYLIKWETVSYSHCTWMSAAWVFGICSSAMRTSFAKRAIEKDLLKFSEKQAIPDEFVTVDIILNVKMSASSRIKSREAEMENISNVSKIFVKFQGLGYDDVVWDSPPSEDSGVLYDAFVEAYGEYIEGKYFRHEPQGRIKDRIRAFKNSEFEEVETQPAALTRGKLMGYQLEGLNWLLKNYHTGRSVVLADEMGLGKTVQVISLVASLIQDKPKCWPFLIVVPNATCPNWRREFKQWTPGLRVVTYHGGKEPQELAYKYELFPGDSSEMKAHAVIMSYDSAQDPKTKVLFKSVNWAGLVVDEGQRLKNDQNLLYLALRSMKIPFRLLLTGTPLQNNKRELFNLLAFIDNTQDAVKLDEEFMLLDKENLPRLHEKIRPYFLRRTKAGVLKFLPPMAQIILPVTMTVIQEKLSRSIMAKNPQLIKSVFANTKVNKKERGSLNNILMQLRKCLCHPFMYSDAIEERHHDPMILHRNLVEASAKLVLLEIMLPKLRERGHRVLIFTQFLNQLDIIEDFLGGIGFEYRRLDGQMDSLEKQRRIDAFNAPDSSIFAFLLSTRAGGVGINLATADTVIIMDPDFNPHQDMQALSRAHRIGQKNKVLCFQLVTKDSVEERIMQVGRKKMALDHALIESMDDDEIAGDDLESILKHGAQALFNDDYQKTAIHYDSAAVDKVLDRSHMEKTKLDDDGSTDAQYAYARVWSNDKNGFDDGLGLEVEEAPEPINSSVWDKILAEREEEAKREAEANREVLGRGGRRRLAVNYKSNAIESIPLPEGVEHESSDSSDDFAGANSTDDGSDEEMEGTGKGKRRKISHVQSKSPTVSPTSAPRKSKSEKIDSKLQQTPKKAKPQARAANPQTPVGRKPKVSPSPAQTKGANKAPKPAERGKKPAAKGAQKHAELPTPSKSSKKAKASGPVASQDSPATVKSPKPNANQQQLAAAEGSPCCHPTAGQSILEAAPLTPTKGMDPSNSFMPPGGTPKDHLQDHLRYHI